MIEVPQDEYVLAEYLFLWLKIAPATAAYYARIGRFPALKLGKTWKYYLPGVKRVLEDLLEQRSLPAPAPSPARGKRYDPEFRRKCRALKDRHALEAEERKKKRPGWMTDDYLKAKALYGWSLAEYRRNQGE